MLHVQIDVAAFEAEVQQEFERREELLKNIHEAETGVKVEPTSKTNIIQRRIEVLKAMLAEEKLSANKRKADQLADENAQIAIEKLVAAEAQESYKMVSEPMGEARRLIAEGGPQNLAKAEALLREAAKRGDAEAEALKEATATRSVRDALVLRLHAIAQSGDKDHFLLAAAEAYEMPISKRENCDLRSVLLHALAKLQEDSPDILTFGRRRRRKRPKRERGKKKARLVSPAPSETEGMETDVPESVELSRVVAESRPPRATSLPACSWKAAWSAG